MKSTPTESSRRPVKRQRPDDGNAFIPDPQGGPALAGDDLAEELAEQFVASATSAEETMPDELDQEVPEEIGGPFIVSDAGREFASGTDASNPRGSVREPMPSPMRGGR